jgi:hypothetical protein
VRDALEKVYLKERRPDILETFKKYNGIWADRKGFDTDRYIRTLRKDARHVRSRINDK